MQSKGKILVIRGGAIGDFILTLPAISALRQQFPDAHLEVLGYPHIAQLAQAGQLVDRVQSIEAGALAGFFARNGKLNTDLQDYFSEFNIIISYLYDPDLVFETNVRLSTAAQFISGPHRAKDTERLHASKVYLKPLERLALFDIDPVPRLKVPGDVAAREQIALHPGSGSESKNWPEARWAQLIALLLQSPNLNLLLVGGEAEADRVQRLAAPLPPHRVHVAQSRPLKDLALLLQECSGFVGHDSGISHLAAAVGLKGVVLWGRTVEEVWRPPSQKVVILRDPKGLATIMPEQVIKELQRQAIC